MELRFHSDDNGSSSGFPISSNNNFFAAQGAYGMNGARFSELMMNPNSVELFHREVEKRRIREQIIAAEIIRRQTLEAEVRRELAMERGFGFQQNEGLSLVTNSSCLPMWSDQKSSHINQSPDEGRAFDERVSFLSGQQVGRIENSPFQRHPDAAKVTDINKGPVLFIPKPTPSVAGTKRKLACGFLGNSKKKIQKDWTCDLCEVKVTCEQGLNDHIKGKKHRLKEAAVKANAAVSKDTSSSVTSEKKSDNPEAEAQQIICGLKPNEEKKPLQVQKKGEASCQEANKTDGFKKKFKYWCECCQIGCHSPAVMADHEGGKKHQIRLRLRDGEDVQPTIVGTPSENGNGEDVQPTTVSTTSENANGEDVQPTTVGTTSENANGTTSENANGEDVQPTIVGTTSNNVNGEDIQPTTVSTTFENANGEDVQPTTVGTTSEDANGTTGTTSEDANGTTSENADGEDGPTTVGTTSENVSDKKEAM